MQKLSVTMSLREKIMGFCYLIFSQFLLPSILTAVLPVLFPGIGNLGLNLVFFFCNFLALCAIFWRFLKTSIRNVPENINRLIAVVAIGYFAHQIMGLLVNLTILFLRPSFSNVNDGQIAQLVARNYPLMVLSTVVLAPVAEELLYRGLLFGSIFEKKPFLAYLISVPAFCAIHVLGYIGRFDGLTLLLCFIQYIPAGLCLGWAYHKSDSIIAPILIHAMVNLGSMAALR